MRVSNVLDAKGREVLTVEPSATVATCVHLLASHRVGALVVSSTGREVAGIISERDIVAGLADEGTSFLERSVASLSGPAPHCCLPHDTLEHLMAVMTDERVRHLPVVDDGRLVGIVSIGDIVKQRLSELETERRQLHDYITTGR
jgi:CBS domain-containing protein